ncbi:unnamed protein product [Adineta steineri]|uniref:RRM domain-containing protein n=1 Tax=Adineta steineri TaxID=433720 RepID=A0A814L5J9_9BILA|nr:unnamed protein product [Adineta steineri]CAF3826003.1 unnamed protein product [Adineta steineri]
MCLFPFPLDDNMKADKHKTNTCDQNCVLRVECRNEALAEADESNVASDDDPTEYKDAENSFDENKEKGAQCLEQKMADVNLSNEMHIPTLNNARLRMKQSEMKPDVLRQQKPDALPKPVVPSPMAGPAPSIPSRSDTPMYKKNVIFINGLPSTMKEQRLFDTLWDEFSTIGRIKIDKQTKEPSIFFIKTNPSELTQSEIFISGLPCHMGEQQLFNIIRDIFSTVGQIQIDSRTGKPCISFSRSRGDKSKLLVDATITFENEETAEKAFKTYNGQRISNLDNVEIHVKMVKKKDHNPLPQPSELMTTTQVAIPARLTRIVIGPNGSKINQIRQETGATIKIDNKLMSGTSNQLITITGNSDQIQQAEQLLQDAIIQSGEWNQ